MDLVILLMWGRIWVALLVQSPQIHLHTFTHTHTHKCLHSGSTRCRRWGASWFVSRDARVDTVETVGLYFLSLHLAAVPAGARIQRFGGKSVDSTSGLSSGFFPRMAKRPQCSTQSTSA